MRTLVLAGCFFFPALPFTALAQSTDTPTVLQRLDRLEKQNSQLEAENKSLQSQLRQLQGAANPTSSTESRANPSQSTEGSKTAGSGEGSAGSGSPNTKTEGKTTEDEAAKKSEETRKAEEKKKIENALKQIEEERKKEEGWTVGESLRMEGNWRNGLWFETPDKAFKWTVGGVVQFDMHWFGADKKLVDSIGRFNNLVDPGLSLQDGMEFRRARLRFSGTIWEQIEFFAQYEFAQALDLRRRTLGINPAATSPTTNDFDPTDNVGFNEVYFGITQLPILGTVRIGRHRESVNFITATSDNNQVWMERGLMFDVFNGDFNFSNGITVQNTFLNDRVYGMFGFFQVNNNSNRGFYAVGDGEYAYDGRVACLPLWNEDEQLWVHLGIDYSYRNLHQRQMRYRARPMIRSSPSFTSPNLLNSGTLFSEDSQQIANIEFAAAWGPLTMAAEASWSAVTNAYVGGLPNPNGTLPRGVVRQGTYTTTGTYVELMYFLTRDHRTYRKDRPGYDRVIPTSPFYLLAGEGGGVFSKGAWEVGLRYDYVDLTDDNVNGGMCGAVTACVNWYLNPNARIQLNYSWMDRIFAPTDSNQRVEGDVQALGLRFNVDF